MPPDIRVSRALIRRRLNSLTTLLDVDDDNPEFWWALAQDLTELDDLAWSKLPPYTPNVDGKIVMALAKASLPPDEVEAFDAES